MQSLFYIVLLSGLVATTLSAPFDKDGYEIYRGDITAKDFNDWNLQLNLEYLELDLFERGYEQFGAKDWEELGYPSYFPDVIKFMADQEVAHSTEIQRILKGRGAKPCIHQYPYSDAKSYIDVAQSITAVGEAWSLGYSWRLDNRSAILTLSQIFTTEARQNAVLKSGAQQNPLNADFDTPLTGSQVWTLAAPFFGACPKTNPPLPFKRFPKLDVKLKHDDNELSLFAQVPKVVLQKPNLCVAFVNQLKVHFVKYDGSSSTVPVPKEVFGHTFVMLTSQCFSSDKGPFVDDETVVAGPAAIAVRSFIPKSFKMFV